MGVQVAFDLAQWRQLFPEFNLVPDVTVDLYANTIAPGLFRNDGGGPVCDAAQQLNLLNLVVAHVVYLMVPVAQGGSAASAGGLVGRIGSATEGSVSVTSALEGLPESAAFWTQSKYGFLFWQATAAFRTFRYRSPGRRGVGGGDWDYGYWPPALGGFPRLL